MTQKLKPMPKTDRQFKTWLRALPPGRKLGAMSYKTCALGQFAKTIGADPQSSMPDWSCDIELALFRATRHLPGDKRVITAKQFRQHLGMREPRRITEAG